MNKTPSSAVHPALAVSRLSGLDKAVVEWLLLHQEGAAQKELLAPTGASQPSVVA